MKEFKEAYFSGERSLFDTHGLKISDCVFADGESPLKECSELSLEGCIFKWKYPLWYSKNIEVKNCTWLEMARSGVWYTDNIKLVDCMLEAPKNFRRCKNVSLTNVNFSNAAETFWSCDGITLDNVTAKGDYFGMNSKNLKINNFKLFGNYAFDGAKEIEVRNSKLMSKDAFWNTENATVYDSYIIGEYLGWNSKNLTFINCTIESLQGLCYIQNLKMKNCKLINTTLSFEYSEADAQINGKIDSVFNPSSGTIKADRIVELTMDNGKIDPSRTQIICDKIDVRKP